MKKEIEINELIERYLLGTLDEDGKIRFAGFLEENPALHRETDLVRRLHGIITDGALLDIKKELSRIHVSKTNRSGKIKRITGYGGAGLVIGLAVFLALHDKNPPQENTPKDILVVRDSGLTVQTPVEQATVKTTEDRDIENKVSAAGRHEAVINNDPADFDGHYVISDSMPVASGNERDTLTRYEQAEVNGMPQIKETEVSVEKLMADDSSENEVSVKADCRSVKITADYNVTASCSNKPTGSILVDITTISGGTPPYGFSIDNKNFLNEPDINSLYPGRYDLYVTDALHCTGILGSAYIGKEECTYNAAFAPFRGEVWQIPVRSGMQGTITIYSSAGSVVYSGEVNETDSPFWNGCSLSGGQLPMGLYQFVIKYINADEFTGTVTIVR